MGKGGAEGGGGGGGGDETWHVEAVEGMLDVWGDGWMNRFVVFSLLERLVVSVLPELAGGGGGGGGEVEAKSEEGESVVKVETAADGRM